MRPFFRITKLPKHRQFTYHPKYWDPDKEALEGRLRKYRDQDSNVSNVELTKSRISSNFRYRRGKVSVNDRVRGNFRLVIILIVVIFLTYLFLDEYAQKIVNWIE